MTDPILHEPILQVRGLNKHFGGVVATENLNFEVTPGEIHAVIGPNGAGKTTFVAQLAGMIKSDSGSILFDGEEITNSKNPITIPEGIKLFNIPVTMEY